jgi:hypothetical protein
MNEPKHIMDLYSQLIEATNHTFPQKGRVNISSFHGVYIIYNPKGKVLHVGKTDRAKKHLSQRLQNHLYNQSSFSRIFLKFNGKILRNDFYFKYLEIENARTRTLVEKLATGLLCPTHIGTGEKKGD